MIIAGPLDSIKITLPDYHKQALKRACFVDDTTMAQFLRKAIRDYIKEHSDHKVQSIIAERESRD